MKERREFNRSSENLQVIVYDFSCDLTVRTAMAENVSLDGFCVLGGAPIKPGEAVSFIMTLPGIGLVSGRSVCRWSSSDQRWGGEIDRMPEEDKAKLASYLDQR